MINQAQINAGSIGSGAPVAPVSSAAGGVRWRVRLVLRGQDLSDRLSGLVRIEAEESAARIAEFALLPNAGPILLADWVGASVQIDYQALDSAGGVLGEWRLFTGLLDLPSYDFTTSIISCRATDGLQQRMEQLTRAQIDAEVGGLWSAAVFDAEADGWTYAQDRLSTQPAAFDLDADGVTPRLTPWAAAGVPHRTVLDAGFVYQSLSVELVPHSDLHNTVSIDLEYRYWRRRHRERQVGWAYPLGFCGWFSDTSSLPTRSMVTGALNGGGWHVRGQNVTELPLSLPNACNSGINWVNFGTDPDPAVIGISGTIFTRIAQPVTESYTLTVTAPQSVDHFGTIGVDDSAALETEDDDVAWEDSDDLAVLDDYLEDPIGDLTLDMPDRPASDNAIRTVLAIARTGILAVHRRNVVGWRMPITPDIDRHMTLRLDATSLRAQGKIVQLVHELDLGSGQAVTDVRIAVSRAGSQIAVAEDPLDPPAPPDTQLTAEPPDGGPIGEIGVGTQLGGRASSPAYNEDAAGYSGNYNIIDPGADIFPVRFMLRTPEVEAAARDNIEAERVATYGIAIPADLLEIIAP